jgi:hypothetical protein
MAGTGGKREGAGRPPKADEEKANVLMLRALKEIYKADNDDKAKVEFIKKLLDSQRGEIFVAEHVFGKAPQVIDQNNTHTVNDFNIKDLVNFDKTKS